MFKKKSVKLLMVLLVALLSVNVFIGCDNDDDEVKKLEIIGTWSGDYGQEVIFNDSWVFSWGLTATISEYSNKKNTLYAQNPATDQFYPNKFSKIVWTEISNNIFYYCTITFGEDTLAEAKADATAYNSSDPDNSGCNGFPWTKLTRVE